MAMKESIMVDNDLQRYKEQFCREAGIDENMLDDLEAQI
jgi:hypothetical protein